MKIKKEIKKIVNMRFSTIEFLYLIIIALDAVSFLAYIFRIPLYIFGIIFIVMGIIYEGLRMMLK